MRTVFTESLVSRKAQGNRRGLRQIGLLLIAVLCLLPRPARSTETWETLPDTPAPIANGRAGYAEVNGIQLFYVDVGSGVPVVVLHGGLANSDYLADQVRSLSVNYRVIAVDSRGHGRSTRDARPFSYDLMSDDVVALLDRLNIRRAAIVGWSDGGIIGLGLALRHPDRVSGVFAFGANTQTSGLKDDVEKNPTFAKFLERTQRDYARLSATPMQYQELKEAVSKMWETQPNWTDAQLRSIRVPVWIVDGTHDEGIKRKHTAYMASTIPNAQLLMLPRLSHFAFLQDPRVFSRAVAAFLASLSTENHGNEK